ncbi:hypothetical protein V1514DRAFT_354866 [Lipomyces japonicus]|uniref:uncharacterized protein n=1 Tax=Lipomyces japonicus TaxID=56871 RepID=UPI0034CF83FC
MNNSNHSLMKIADKTNFGTPVKPKVRFTLFAMLTFKKAAMDEKPNQKTKRFKEKMKKVFSKKRKASTVDHESWSEKSASFISRSWSRKGRKPTVENRFVYLGPVGSSYDSPKACKALFRKKLSSLCDLPVYSRSADESEKRAQPVVAKDGSGASVVCTHIDKIKSITAAKEGPDLSKFIYLGPVEDGYKIPLSSEATFRRELSRFRYMPILSELATVCFCYCHSHNLNVKIKVGKLRSKKRSPEIKKQGLTKKVEHVDKHDVRFVHAGSVDEKYTSPGMATAVVRKGATKCRALAIYYSPVKGKAVVETSQVCGPVSTHVDTAKPDTKFEEPSSNLVHGDNWFGRLCENIHLPSCFSILKTMFYITAPEVTAEDLTDQQAMADVVLPAKPMPSELMCT